MTTETSNARGEWVLVPRVPTPQMVQASDDISCRAEGAEHWAAMLAAAPPPAAARGDVRGLVALAEQMERDAAGCRRDGYTDAAVVKEDCAQRIRQTLGISAIAEALAAEGVQAGEVEQRARELLEAECGRPLPLDVPVCAAHSAVVAALSQQPEARGVVDVTDEMVERGSLALSNALGGNVVCKALRKDVRAILTAALTGERNG